ncbi:MAG: hypothetical protein N3D10_03880, partial [Candidatus Micrarchaeota archaeon]|nr:hypothetical protein [Candidatus Micrarchaeota archaeon]
MLIKRGQISIEQIIILGFVLLLGVLVLNFFGFFSDPTATKVKQSKIYWSAIAYPIKITEFGISKYEAEDGVLFAATINLNNPTAEKITIRKLIFEKGKFEDVYEGERYLGKANNLYILLLPSSSKTITLYSFEQKNSPNLYNPARVFESQLTIYFDSSLPNQIQKSTSPIVDYIGQYSGAYSQSQNLFNNQTFCPTGYVPCPDSNNCVPSGYCLPSGAACLPPNTVCNNNCCSQQQICYNGECRMMGDISCEPPNIFCGPDEKNSYYCCDATNSICDQNLKKCVVCSSPNSVACNRVCCPDGQYCDRQNSRCLSSCSSPNFVCPANSSNCCDGNIYSYCDPATGSCLRAGECTPPKISCGPDENGITYCCDGRTSICNSTSRKCQNCPSGIACAGQCCKQNYLCLGGSCYCPLSQRYYIAGEEFCCPENHIYNYSIARCEPCAQEQIACKDKCCLNNTICNIANNPTQCVDCCPDNTFNCEDKYCCNYSSACISGQCVEYCPANQVACLQPNGSISCCPEGFLCSQPSGACVPIQGCDSSLQCGKFCCQENQYCYDGRCVDSYPQPPKCPSELRFSCPQQRLCGIAAIDQFGNPYWDLNNSVCCS